MCAKRDYWAGVVIPTFALAILFLFRTPLNSCASGDISSNLSSLSYNSMHMNPNTYESPLASRNASPEMLRLFSPQYKFGLWRRLWLELARHERELGISKITSEALRQMEGNLDKIDFARAADWEKRLRHDV